MRPIPFLPGHPTKYGIAPPPTGTHGVSSFGVAGVSPATGTTGILPVAVGRDHRARRKVGRSPRDRRALLDYRLRDGLDSGPTSTHAASVANKTRRILLEDEFDRLATDPRTLPFNLSDGELSFDLVQDRNHICGLVALLTDKRRKPLLKSRIAFVDRVQ